MVLKRHWWIVAAAIALALPALVPAVGATLTGSADIKALYRQDSMMAYLDRAAAVTPEGA